MPILPTIYLLKIRHDEVDQQNQLVHEEIDETEVLSKNGTRNRRSTKQRQNMEADQDDYMDLEELGIISTPYFIHLSYYQIDRPHMSIF